METRARKRTRERRDATVANAGEAFRGLPDHLVVEHILRSDILGDPIDLARLRAVIMRCTTQSRRRGGRLKS